ncbi:transcriptional regulator, TetR family [Nocardioides sp. YR527]|uniref:TetR/AcrR family transcriptional regulator n=1 Tax=Nocardioides sp. YR527 TaxID=1881028 RepID=UPI0008874519|nr:TetR/AcrR family transcriptional regulator [Nocardioides sp. YR527]SDJ82831.1 transcriptional regulator, TetR family [Nocardioides sp. YR527]
MTRKVKDDGRSSRWDAHRETRRAELVAAAVRAVDSVGAEVSITDIAVEAGVSKPVLYRYFADKAELHAAVGMWAARQILDAVVDAVLAPAPTRERVGAGVAAYVETIAEHPNVYLLLVRQHTGGTDPLADGKQLIAATFARLLGDTFGRLGVDAAGAEPWAHGLVGIGESAGQWWLERRTMSRAAFTRYLSEFVWHALEGTTAEYGVDLSALDRPEIVTPLRKSPR